MLVGLAGAAAWLLVLGFMVFAAGVMRAPEPVKDDADAIVVLTGTESRIREGVRLLREGRGRRLLISGVNRQTTKAELMKLAGLQGTPLEEAVDLGYEALDTIGNADETRIWAEEREFASLIVVTSSYHMPRSMAELRLAMPGKRLISQPVLPKSARPDAWWLHVRTTRVLIAEYLKYLPAAARLTAQQLMSRPLEQGRVAGQFDKQFNERWRTATPGLRTTP